MDAHARCPDAPGCAVFPTLRSDPAMRMALETYCFGTYQRCARFQSGERGQLTPPSDLLPNGRRRSYVACGVRPVPALATKS